MLGNLPSNYPHSFEELKIPFIAVASDYYNWGEVHFTKGDMKIAIAASIAIPAVFKPIVYGDTLLVDGGCVNPMPFDVLPKESDLILAADILGGPRRQADEKTPSVLNSIMGASTLFMQSIINQKLKQQYPHILLRPKGRKFNAMEFGKFNEIIENAQPLRVEAKNQLHRMIEVQNSRQIEKEG